MIYGLAGVSRQPIGMRIEMIQYGMLDLNHRAHRRCGGITGKI